MLEVKIVSRRQCKGAQDMTSFSMKCGGQLNAFMAFLLWVLLAIAADDVKGSTATQGPELEKTLQLLQEQQAEIRRQGKLLAGQSAEVAASKG